MEPVEYRAWANMKQRCYNPKHTKYPEYGGRGITVCQEWRDSFEAFMRDMGPRPLGCTLDRIRVNEGYYKENCRWADAYTQALNRRVYRAGLPGISGIAVDKAPNNRVYWRAYAQRCHIRYHLYYGNDLFEACCARKSWELTLDSES